MDNKLSLLTSIPVVDRVADFLYIVDTSGGTSNKVTPNNLLGITGNPVGHTDTQTLTNKTLTAPTISSPVLSGTITGTYTIGGTPTFPSSVATLTGSQTLTNKTLTSPTINTATIVNPTLTVDAVSEFTSANGVTIDGLNIKDSMLNTNNSVPNNALSNTGLFGSAWAWQAWTPTVTAGGGTFTSVAGTGRYTQIGKTIFYKVDITITTVGTATGEVLFTLPGTAQSGAGNVGSGREDAVSGKIISAKLVSTTQASSSNYDNTSWIASGSIGRLSGFFEVA